MTDELTYDEIRKRLTEKGYWVHVLGQFPDVFITGCGKNMKTVEHWVPTGKSNINGAPLFEKTNKENRR